ncbi:MULTISPECIES: TerB family tellurite resistance protein [Cyanophyceae]|uniref:tellurite resistance TerB family protein n=1 Tax=Cyanophyceae TaxID=3028117 RepID=UPI001683E41F|nr:MULTISPECIES: TerB family tellurite resistance protein [Cyanophyceae]MBD1917155.1 TerB family tellurite resistance protein [Phormidium sp. FACHB-77]MBD2030686.1 TerB family tellurite resistance protein [Phormidium sp. FACHB-322]MBD2050206.1 TerB family tellurite resistance protein [Leptolyngbya sp. FACHB-60]
MPIQPPLPPSITPSQMTLLRIASTMAWSDGHLADEEVGVMLDQFSRLFASDAKQQAALHDELRDYLMQNLPLEELVPKLTRPAERELVLKLGRQVISASARTPGEELINQQEADAYNRLVSLLDLPEEVVQRIEQDSSSLDIDHDSLIDQLAAELKSFVQGA